MGQKYSIRTTNCATGPDGDGSDKMLVDANESVSPVDLKTKSLTTMESLHNATHDIFPVPFEGLKVVLNQGLNQHFQLNHSWTFSGTDKQSGYKFGATYVGHNKLSESEIYPIMLGELSPSGALNAQIIHQLSRNVKCKFVSQMRPSQVDGQQMTVEYRHEALNAGVSVVNPSVRSREVSVIVDVMRRLSERAAAGSMLVMQRSGRQQAPAPNFAVWSVGGSWTSVSGAWTAAMAARPLQSSAHATFSMRLPGDRLQVGTELEASLAARQCVATAGYQYELGSGSSSCATVKSQIDTNWKIATSYERKFLAPIPFSINFCVNGDLWKSAYGLGIGFSLL